MSLFINTYGVWLCGHWVLTGHQEVGSEAARPWAAVMTCYSSWSGQGRLPLWYLPGAGEPDQTVSWALQQDQARGTELRLHTFLFITSEWVAQVPTQCFDSTYYGRLHFSFWQKWWRCRGVQCCMMTDWQPKLYAHRGNQAAFTASLGGDPYLIKALSVSLPSRVWCKLHSEGWAESI